MPRIDLVVETALGTSSRVRQLEAMFDVPSAARATRRWEGDLPLEERDWNIGLIVGPSGCGKSTILSRAFGAPKTLKWGKPSVVDDFNGDLSMQIITETCQAVGFNTVPAWMRPYKVLSNGEKFRVEMARRLIEEPDPILVDEFTSVVDRQVATIAAHAVQKYVRRNNRRFIAATCHYDVIDWLQPDWVLEPATMEFQWRSLQRRPDLRVEIARVPYSYWRVFAPFHYLTAELSHAARCFALFVDGTIAAFAGVLYRPHPRVRDVVGLSRLVTLPDFQGFGLAMVLADTVASAYAAVGRRFHTYPAHPSLIRSFDKSPRWGLHKRAGVFSQSGRMSRNAKIPAYNKGGRPCAVFEYVGDPMQRAQAETFLDFDRVFAPGKSQKKSPTAKPRGRARGTQAGHSPS